MLPKDDFQFTKTDYYNKLVVIRGVLEEEIFNFPKSKCQHASRVLKEVLDLEEVAGHYLPVRWHAWNYDPKNKLYVDLTMDQFDDCHNKIMVLPVGSSLLRENLLFTKHQNIYNDEYFKHETKRIISILKKLF